MPSPMALNPSSLSLSIFKKNSSPNFPASAEAYLSAVYEADRRRTNSYSGSPTLSLSSVTTSTDDTAFEEEKNWDNDDGISYPSVPPTSEQTFNTNHAEFGHCANEDYRYISQHTPGTTIPTQQHKDPVYYFLLYCNYIILVAFGHLRDFFGSKLKPAAYKHLQVYNGFAPLVSDFDSFYTRRFKARLEDCFGIPVTGVPGRTIITYDRVSDDNNANLKLSGKRIRGLNIASYNYLGFAQGRGGCADAVEECISRYGISSCGARLEGGSIDLHTTTESLVAQFVGMEDSVVSSMGFATNSTIIPALVSKGCLVISDELNHASIRLGVRFSGATVRTFSHNDVSALETLLREVISQGQPRSHRPWKKILLIVEGLYSMEGTMANLPAIIELKKKYKFYLFVDEAHSIGAMGRHGRGVTDYFGVDPRSIDILMGTLTKSFGAFGGYVAGSKALIKHIRAKGHSGPYAESMTPPVLAQIISSMASIMGVADIKPNGGSPDAFQHYGPDKHYGPVTSTLLPSWMKLPPSLRDGSEGRVRLRRLAFNSRYLSRGMSKLGFITYGVDDSPIVPLLLCYPGKVAQFSRMMRQMETPVFVVVVGYPATTLATARARLCISASHTKEDIDKILTYCDLIGDLLDLKYGSGERWPLQRILDNAVELVNA